MSERDLQRIEVLTEVLAGRRTLASAATAMFATRRIEAAVYLSFDLALPERSSSSNLPQISGRVNRNGGRPRGELWHIVAEDPSFISNPALLGSLGLVQHAFKWRGSDLRGRLCADRH